MTLREVAEPAAPLENVESEPETLPRVPDSGIAATSSQRQSKPKHSSAAEAPLDQLEAAQGLLLEQQALFDIAPVGVAVLLDGVVRKCNARLEEIAGVGSGELIGRPLRIGHTDAREWQRVAPRIDAEIRAGGIAYCEIDAGSKAGERLWVAVRARAVDLKHPEGAAIYVITDITESKLGDQRVRESEQRFRSFTALSSDWYWEQDEQFRFVSFSGAVGERTGISSQTIIGRRRWELPFVGVTQSEWAAHRAQIEAHQPFQDFEMGRVQEDGSVTWMSVSGEPIFGANGHFRGYRGVGRSITARKRTEVGVQTLNAELERRVAELDAAHREMESFTYSVSHDLRSPLRALDGFSRMLVEEHGQALDEEARAYLARISTNAQLMGQLIDGLLDLSRTMRARMLRHEVDLSRMASEVVAGIRQADREREVDFVIAPQVLAEGDPTLLRIVLHNLLSNAWKFTQKRALARIEFGTAVQEGGRVFFVRDDGVGFDMAYADKLFGAFQRLHGVAEFAGTGIGLVTVQRIVQRHGGRAWAEGALGRGATFYFTLG
jgi:PAS domain S-box-containing protein